MGVVEFGRRMMTSLAVGFEAAREKWRNYDYKPEYFSPSYDYWDDYKVRISRYHLLELYYDNKVFTTIETYRGIHLRNSNEGLYKSTRPIYNPTGRLVNLYPAMIYGGQLDMANLDGGAIPIQTENDLILEALKQLYTWSNWQQEKSLYVRTGAKKGDVLLKIVDERSSQKVRLEVLDPGRIREIQFDAVGNVKAVEICYERLDPRTNRWYEYAEFIDGDQFITYRDGKEYAFYEDASGNPVSHWTNDYGFVPLVYAPHRKVGRMFAVAAIHQIMGKIDELNSIASSTHDQIHKSVNFAMKATGVTPPSATGERSSPDSLQVSDSKSEVPIYYLPKDGDLAPLVGSLDITSAMQAMSALMDEIEADTPELALSKIRDHGQLTAPGVKLGYADAIGLITESMGNYDAALVRAQQMAITMGGMGGYRGFESFNANSYDNGDLEHSIKPRPIIRDDLSRGEKVNAMLGAAESPLIFEIMKELGFTEDEAREAEMKVMERQTLQAEMQQQTALMQAGAMIRQNSTRQNGQQPDRMMSEAEMQGQMMRGNGNER